MEWWDYLSICAGVAGVVFLVFKIATGNDERADEDTARRFFDEHGHWPDEDPSQADRRYEL